MAPVTVDVSTLPNGSSVVPPRRVPRKTASILSLDGGGSRGVMECVVLDAIYNMATLILEHPDKMPSVQDLLKRAKDEEEKAAGQDFEFTFKQELENAVAKPMHPKETCDMIVGTSTGGLISYALLAGNKGDNGHKRQSMTVQEVIGFYRDETKPMFSESVWGWSPTELTVSAILRSYNFYGPYPQTHLKRVLERVYEDTCLKDIDDDCIAGCVAKSVCTQEEELKFFNTVSLADRNLKISEVLLATCDAPVYFKGPTKVGDRKFVDGGVGGNCPLKQAIPAAMDLMGYSLDLFIISLAPPRPVKTEIPSGNLTEVAYWLGYFPSQVTDGEMIYNEVKAEFTKLQRARFYRLAPRGEKLQGYSMDETNVDAMVKDTEKWVFSHDGLIEILPVVFAVVGEYLRRARAEDERTSRHVAGPLLIHNSLHSGAIDSRSGVLNGNGYESDEDDLEPQANAGPRRDCRAARDWMLSNYGSLIDAFQGVGFLDDLESTKYLLMTVLQACENTRAHEVPQSNTEINLQLRIGETCIFMGEPLFACEYFEPVLRYFAKNAPSTPHEQQLQAEAHLLQSKALYEIGDYQYTIHDHTRELIPEGSQYHVEKARTILDDLGGDHHHDQEHLLRATRVQESKLLLHLDDYEQAMKHFKGGKQLLGSGKQLLGSGKDSTDQAGRKRERRPSHTSPSSVKADELDFQQLYALALFKAGQESQAKEEFEAILRQTQSDATGTETCPWFRPCCDAFVALLGGKTEEAYNTFSQAFDSIERIGYQRLNVAVAANYSYMAYAAYMNHDLNESLQQYRRAKQTVLIVDPSSQHPLIAASNGSLGAILTQQKSFQEAWLCLRESITQYKRFMKGEVSQELIEVKSNRACLNFAEGKFARALKRFESALVSASGLPRSNEELVRKLKMNLEKAKAAVAAADGKDEAAVAEEASSDGVDLDGLQFFVLI